MHRHGYKGRKFGRERDQRAALIKGLVSSFIEHGRIETTLPKAKEIAPFIEKLITKAKKGDLASRRAVIASVSTLDIANKLVDGIAPQLTKRDSGHIRIVRTKLRVGDNAQMATIEFVDEIKEVNKPEPAKKPAATKKAAKVKKEVKA
jgi:large subunit ribosomal protein L17